LKKGKFIRKAKHEFTANYLYEVLKADREAKIMNESLKTL